MRQATITAMKTPPRVAQPVTHLATCRYSAIAVCGAKVDDELHVMGPRREVTCPDCVLVMCGEAAA